MHHTFLDRLDLLGQSALSGKPALVDNHNESDYSQLTDTIAQVAAWLHRLDVRVVALQAQNSIDWIIVDLACQVAGVVCLPLPEFFTRDQMQGCLRAAATDIVLTDNTKLLSDITGNNDVSLQGKERVPALSLYAYRIAWSGIEVQGKYPQGTQKITFTSGSTGTPKGVCLSMDHQWKVAESLARLISIEHPRHLCLLPLSTLLENIAGVYVPLLCSGSIILPDSNSRGLNGSSKLDIHALTHCMDYYQPESVILLPQLLSALVVAAQQGWQPPSSLKFAAVGGARVAPGLIQEARRLDIPAYEGYGLSECGSVVALNTHERDLPGSVGRVLPHCEVSIEEGEIMVTGSCHLGYLNEPGGWYSPRIATGDLGTLDEEGWLFVDGRRKNLLISSFGRNISPEWVESALNARPLLSHCVVMGDGEPYLTALLSAPESVSDQDIRHWVEQVNQQLPDYARVKKWQRLKPESWQGLLTANGRPRRQKVSENLSAVIEHLYRYADNRPSIST